MSEVFPVLYILMRNDLASMNAGKGMAQASHASNAFLKHMDEGNSGKHPNEKEEMDGLASLWKISTSQGFGTVLVLGVNEIEMRTSVEVASALGFPAEVIHDPTYPLVDGDTVHFLPLDTCAYVFGDKNDPLLSGILGNFKLHP